MLGLQHISFRRAVLVRLYEALSGCPFRNRTMLLQLPRSFVADIFQLSLSLGITIHQWQRATSLKSKPTPRGILLLITDPHEGMGLSQVAQLQRTCQPSRRHRFSPWVGMIPWRRKWPPSPVFLPEKSHGQRSLAGYCPWGLKRVGRDLATKQQQNEDMGSQRARHD